ncbi:MAG: DUF4437 domain-containing protein [Alphaproteobacteria bacterium]
MARPLTEFIQSQWLPWQPEPLWPHLAGVSHRVLSRDEASDAVTALLRFPPGWVANAAPACTLHEELYALDGAVSVNSVFFPADYYGFLPAGFPRQRSTAPQGCVALAYYTPAAAQHEADYDHSRWVPRTDVFSAIWPAAEPRHGLDLATHHARARVLWTDPDDGAQTLIVGYPPVWHAATIETQDTDAEHYLLAGDCTISGRGTMTPGGYIWRPKGSTRAPMSSRTGTVFLIRTHGGPLALTATGTGPVDAAAVLDCAIPPETAVRFSDGPYAAKGAA